MSNDRIRAGLIEMEKAGSKSTANMAPTTRLAAMSGLNVSIQSVRELRVKAKTLHTEIANLHTDLAKEDKAKTARIKREHDDLGWMPDEKGRGRIDHLGSAKRKQLRDAALAKMRKALRATVVEKAEALRVKIRELEETRGYLREAWSTPLVYLNRSTLLSPERATAQAVLNGAGAYQLNAAASEAIRSANPALAAAVCMATERLDKTQRGLMRYSREEIAASVGFNEYSDANTNLEAAKYDLASAELDGRELVGVKVRPEERMKLGTGRAEFEAQLGKPIAEIDFGKGSPNEYEK